MRRVKPGPLPTYVVTHVSVEDGSPAMLLRVEHGRIGVFVNEDGFTWADDMALWTEV